MKDDVSRRSAYVMEWEVFSICTCPATFRGPITSVAVLRDCRFKKRGKWKLWPQSQTTDAEDNKTFSEKEGDYCSFLANNYLALINYVDVHDITHIAEHRIAVVGCHRLLC